MADRWDIRPDILQGHALGVHRVTMTAIVLDLATTMAAGKDWRSDASKGVRLSLRVVQQAVMARVQAPRDRQACADLDCDPMTKLKPELGQVRTEEDIPLREVIDEDASAWLQHTD